MGRNQVLITAALPYANGPLHFGHLAGSYLPADCYARFQRLRGAEVLFISGSDEYGVAIALSAELAQRTPQEHVDLFHATNRSFFERLAISFDFYGRTTSSVHQRRVQEFYTVLARKGLVEKKTENHLYSEQEGRFLADRYVVGVCPKCGYESARGDECPRCAASYEATDLGRPTSKLTGAPLQLKPSTHLYFRFDRFQEPLRRWLETKAWKESVTRFAMHYVDELKPRAITRDSEWGVPVPDFPQKVFYVWFDAPIGYLSLTEEWAIARGEPERWKEYWLDPTTKRVQFLGKDNIPFHAVFFPAMLLGQDLPYQLPSELPANEFYLLEGRQFSKSEGWTIDLDLFLQRFQVDQLRYAIAANAPETADSSFSWKEFQMRSNAELLAKLGNFVHRVLVFARQHGYTQVPALGALTALDVQFVHQMERLLEEIAHEYETFHVRKACQKFMELAQLGNGYFDSKKPWHVVKEEGGHVAVSTTIGCSLQCIRLLALAASPVIPHAAQMIWERLGYQTTLAHEHWQEIATSWMKEGQSLLESVVLFRKIEDVEIEEEIRRMTVQIEKGSTSTTYEPLKAEVTYDQFQNLDLRVAQILHAEKIAKSKKLLKLEVDLGFEKRTIVSGIALSYSPEELVGKKVVVIANLAPAVLMGVESRGMLLAAGELPELLFLQSMSPGSVVR